MASQDKKSPSALSAALGKAVEHHRAGDLAKARTLYLAYLSRNPVHAAAWTNYGALLRQEQKFLPAIAAHRRAVEIDPDYTAGRNNLANTLADDGQFEESAAIRRALCHQFPREPMRERDLCAALRGMTRHEEVIDRVNRAVEEGWADGECRLQRGLSRLMLGDYAGGFADFEYRYDSAEVSLPKNTPWPRWQGEPLTGKRVLVLPEQGFGDAILASRFLPWLKALGAEVHAVIKPPLRRLLSDVAGIDQRLDERPEGGEYDFYIPNMSLPHLTGRGGEIPPLPRLSVPTDSRERARRIIEPFDSQFKVGIVWTGNAKFKSNNRRSTQPESFAGLAQIPGVQLFSLYKGPAHQDFIESGMAGLIVDACGHDRDFADSAAIIDEMDLMITTDTAVVHVAGSLEKPIWNLLSHESFWLYGLGETTPWYPSMRLFRQRAQGDWNELFTRVENTLREHLSRQATASDAAG
ncbi:MAG: hypothetical protein RJQ08_12325 [Salinisphaeraceae bacterium]